MSPLRGLKRCFTQVEALLRKGGLKCDITQQVKNDIKLTRYRSEKVALSFQVFLFLKAPILLFEPYYDYSEHITIIQKLLALNDCWNAQT